LIENGKVGAIQAKQEQQVRKSKSKEGGGVLSSQEDLLKRKG
jgi:hypothetical protein